MLAVGLGFPILRPRQLQMLAEIPHRLDLDRDRIAERSQRIAQLQQERLPLLASRSAASVRLRSVMSLYTVTTLLLTSPPILFP